MKIVDFASVLTLSDFMFALKVWSFKKGQNIEAWIKLGQVLNKSLFPQTIPNKTFGAM